MTSAAAIPVTALRVAELLPEGEPMPVYVHVIDHPDARILVDTGMTELHPAVADMDPRLYLLTEQDFDINSVDIVVNTHLHFDHCGGNHLFAGKPIYVQRQELEDARTKPDYDYRMGGPTRAAVRPDRRRVRTALRYTATSCTWTHPRLPNCGNRWG